MPWGKDCSREATLLSEHGSNTEACAERDRVSERVHEPVRRKTASIGSRSMRVEMSSCGRSRAHVDVEQATETAPALKACRGAATLRHQQRKDCMRTVVVVTLSLVAIVAPVSKAQAPSPMTFEGATVRPNESVGQGGSMSGPNRSPVRISNVPLATILLDAFQLPQHRVVGLPGWTRSARFDIAAVFPDGVESAQAYRPMLQQLLADRFGLRSRRETRELPIYRLSLVNQDGRLGPQMMRSDVDCVRWFAEQRPQVGAGGKSPVTPDGTRIACVLNSQRNWVSGHAQPVSRLAERLAGILAAQVLDATGLTGNFDLDLAWSPDAIDPATGGLPANPTAADSGSIFTAIREQLGLKLDSARGPVEVLVIDQIERPIPD